MSNQPGCFQELSWSSGDANHDHFVVLSMFQVFVHYDFAMVICFEDIPGEPPLNCTGCGLGALLQRSYDCMQIIAIDGDGHCHKMTKLRHRLQDGLGPGLAGEQLSFACVRICCCLLHQIFGSLKVSNPCPV